TGLLPLLKSIQKPCNLKTFSGQTIGVDAYGWLHRGVVSCAVDLAMGKPTMKHIDFCMNRVRMLIHFGIKPYLVFDGDNLPGKAGTNAERAAKRKESRKQGMELLRLGKTSQAHAELQKAVDVTPDMARILIEELKRARIDYVVAPYEADSQLVYLERQGLIQGILSEDSDLLVFGAKVLITKLDQYGECIAIDRKDFTACRDVSLVGWSDAEFRKMAILSGCDYLPSISKMGLKTAHRLMRKYKSVDRLLRAVQFDGQFKVPPGYLEAFNQAEMTFLYQWVFCPLSNELVNFTPLEPGMSLEQLAYIGKHVEAGIAKGVAVGDLHPGTKKPMIVQPSASRFPRSLAPSSAVMETPDPKKRKPIEAFFKPKRIPLAELDPNLFTPSPSQEQIMLQNQRENPITTRTTGSPLVARSNVVSSSVPQPSRRAISDSMIARHASLQPAKRQRLCSDSAIYAATGGAAPVETAKSRFFSSPSDDASPSIRNGRSGNKTQKSEINLWSDDSLEEAMAELPDASQTSLSSKKSAFSVFRESSFTGTGRTSSMTSSTNTSQRTSSTLDLTNQKSQNTAGTATPATSFNSQSASTASQMSFFSRCLNSEIGNLSSRFSYESASASGSSKVAAIKMTAATSNGISRVKSAPEAEKQQIGLSIGTTAVSPLKRPVREILESQSDVGDTDWAAMEAEIVVPGSEFGIPDANDEATSPPHLPAAVESSFRIPESPLKVRGSEDLIIPDSEAESE
ncbi:hypothetical protein K490DRAFT_16366, partial [Saccharata proteae CBS 121410]